MPVKKLKPRGPMDSAAAQRARAAVERLSQEPVTEGTVLLRLGAMRRHQYRALCALVGSDSPQDVIDFAMRITGLRRGQASTRLRLAELNRES